MSPRVETAYLARMQSFGHLMVAVVAGREEAADVPEVTRELMATTAVGAVSYTVMTWANADFSPARDQVDRDAGPVPGRGGDGRAGDAPAGVTCVTPRCGIDCLHSNVTTTDSRSEARWTPRPC